MILALSRAAHGQGTDPPAQQRLQLAQERVAAQGVEAAVVRAGAVASELMEDD